MSVKKVKKGTVVPQSRYDTSYYIDNDPYVRSMMHDFYASNYSYNNSMWAEADKDLRYYSGDASIWDEYYGNLPIHRRRTFNFNHIRTIVNTIWGHQARNMKSTLAVPRENASQDTADQFTKVMMWAYDKANINDTFSDSCHGALITGMNLLHIWMDYRSDPVSGNIQADRLAYNSFLIDPFFRKPDLSDCRGIFQRAFLTIPEAISLFPERESEILSLGGSYNAARDGKFYFLPENYNYDRTNLIAMDLFHYRDFRSATMLYDVRNGMKREWPFDDKEALDRYLSQFPMIESIETMVPTTRVAIALNDRPFYNGPNQLGSDLYPYVPVLSYYSPELPYYWWRVQGVVRGLRDPQYLYNRRKVLELDSLEAQASPRMKVKEGSMVNPDDAYTPDQGWVLWMKKEAQMSDVEIVPPPGLPPSWFQVSQQLEKEFNMIAGVTEELMGSADDTKAGITEMIRQGASLTTLQGLFKGWDLALKLLGKLVLDVISINFTPGKVEMIIDDQPTEEFYNRTFGVYDVSIEEGVLTPTQRQQDFVQRLHLLQAGVPISHTDLIRSSTMQNKEETIKAMEEQQREQQQREELQLQIQLEEQRARTELAYSRSHADRGLGDERYSRIPENQALAVERRAEARKDRYLGFLHLMQAMKELEQNDLQYIAQALKLEREIRYVDKREEAEETIEQQITSPPQSQKFSGGQTLGTLLPPASTLSTQT